MDRIEFPLTFGIHDARVADLQDALRQLLAGEAHRLDDTERDMLDNLLRTERDEGVYGDATQFLVRIFQVLHSLPSTGDVDRDTADALNRLITPGGAVHHLSAPQLPVYEVTGFVRLADGSPAPATKVRAFDRDLRSEQLLGEVETDNAGQYAIRYGDSQFSSAEAGSADLVVKAFGPDDAPVAVSAILFNAPSRAQIDVVIPVEKRLPPSLCEKIEATLRPLLSGVGIGELDEDENHQDLSFLSGETGYAKATLARFVLSYLLVKEGLQPEFWFALLGGSFFVYAEDQSLQQQLPRLLGTLSSVDAAAARKALDRSFTVNDVPAALQANIASWIEAFLALMARNLVAATATPSFTKLALDHAGISSPDQQEKFARLFNQYQAVTPDLLTALEQDSSFSTSEIADLRTSYQLSDLTRAVDFSVVKTLKDQFNIRQPEQIRILAKQGPEQWSALITGKAASGEIKIPIDMGDIGAKVQVSSPDIYGRALERQFRQAYPTAAFLGGIERAASNGGAKGLTRAADIQNFLDAHDNFELLNTPIDKFLDNGVHPALHEVAQDDGFRTELKAVQRVFKVAPTFQATDTLLADGVHSAQMIYRIGQGEFVERYADSAGLSQQEAVLAWNKAADTHAAVLTIVGDLKALQAEGLPAVLQNGSDAVSTFPNWNNLFSAGDLCDCEECRSVLGPAAYYADILMFLKDRKAADPAFTVKDILFARRPDLGFLELDCDNALTPLPYIDVVCEVLEKVIAGDANDLELTGFTAISADSDTAHADVLAAFKPIDLGATFSLTQVKLSPAKAADPNGWVVHGDDITYLLKKKATSPNFFAEVLPNTKADADELRAYPAYVNAAAYNTLSQARYPFTLPFDLSGEEVRAGFAKCNLDRWDLMRTLRGPANNSTDGEIAAEFFGISAIAEKDIIVGADTKGQQAVWGETGNADWLNTIAVVKTFLAKTSLEYEDLLVLLDLAFVNADGSIAIQHLDGSCDTDKMLIQGLNETKLDVIHRFLRLWRKLDGWKMYEVDLVIRQPAIGAGSLDEPFLIQLFHFSRLRSRLGARTTVEQVCSLFGNLNTETHFTELHKKRADGLYQTLFLNKKHMQPLDDAFDVVAVNVSGPTAETISGHSPVVLGALGVRQADLDVFSGLIRPSSPPTAYITDDLTLANLSFLWRHSWLAKQLKFKASDWKILLKIFRQDIPAFANPKAAINFVEQVDRLTASGFKPDQLDWLLAANRMAAAAPKETDTIRLLSGLRKDLQVIEAEYDPAQYPFLSPPSDPDSLAALLTSLLQKLQRDEVGAQFFVATLQDAATIELKLKPTDLPPTFDFPDAIKTAIAVTFDAKAATLRFTGLMTAAQQTTLLTDPSLAAVTGIAAYQQAIAEFFQRPRLALKFFTPDFAAPLDNLPASVDFKNLPTALRLKIGYDADNKLLTLVGILTPDDKAALDALSPDPTNPANPPDPADPLYHSAVNSLYTQPVLGVFPPEQIWLQDSVQDSDLKFPLRDLVTPTQDNLAANLAQAVTKALAYLKRTDSENLVVQQSAAQFGLTESLTRSLLTQYKVVPAVPDPLVTLLAHLTQTFVATTGSIAYDTLKTTFDGWYWAGRVAALWKAWKLTSDDLPRVVALTPGAQLLDPLTLPLDGTQPIAPLDLFLRTSRLMRVRDALPETDITLLEVLEKLNDGQYAAATDFGTDVERLNDAWTSADVAALTGSLDVAYPNDYLLAETWERLRAAFQFLDNLNGGAATISKFAVAVMTDAEAKALKNLLRSKFGDETWLNLSGEIQDALRERKRACLDAYILTLPQLTLPKPSDVPSGKWENTDDLYAYYLLDVEMCACLLTSRLVQASGSVQLFVQRCLMGLEPNVAVAPDGDNGDSAWRWWTWMSKYRVWEANREVFLWPENWIEPELKKDRSAFFKELESDLQQNDITEDSAEQAYLNYLEKLEGVAQLEIAGFYQEDDGDNTIIHVFGRTTGAEPHLYYYRRFDYRQWTPWEKVDLDIQGDYLVPAVVGNRLYLFWPVFTEVQDETSNSTVDVPAVNEKAHPIQKTYKNLQMQMAISDYHQGKWTPKRISKEYDTTRTSYNVEITRNHYRFFAIDRSEIDGRFVIAYDGYSDPADPAAPVAQLAQLVGAFEITGCAGLPVRSGLLDQFSFLIRPESDSTGDPTLLKWTESSNRADKPENDLTFASVLLTAATLNDLEPLPQPSAMVLKQTPWLFSVSPAWQLSYLDQLLFNGLIGITPQIEGTFETGRITVPVGSWLPFFYNDKMRTFFALPSVGSTTRDVADTVRSYYPDIKSQFKSLNDILKSAFYTLIDGLDLSTFSISYRESIEVSLSQHFSEEPPPPYADAQLKDLLVRYLMRLTQLYLGLYALQLLRSCRYDFRNFYHPFLCDFVKRVSNPLQGIPGLMRREVQLQDSGFSFRQNYQPTYAVVDPSTEAFYPQEVVDFAPAGAYASYNWELFYHAPLMIGNLLSKNQRFEEARDWYHYIFNPIGVSSTMPGGSAMSKYWITKPFFETTDKQYLQQRIENIMLMLAGDASVPDYSAQAKKDLEDQVLDWRNNPFEPHRIASYRTVAYQKTVVMKYLDNLIAWGDYLFAQDSMESINQATQLYIMAAEILGPKPQKIPPQAKPPVESFNELEDEFDAFSNALVQVENLVPPMPGNGQYGPQSVPLPMLYFCIPQNDQMLGYWGTVADRLYKIRHCMNIEGVVRQLALFEPPIDPGALVKAVADGLDISSALADLNAPLPVYRFNVLLQKANEVCADVKALGSALLVALEKKDAEALNLLRQSQEIRVLHAAKAVHQQQLDEAKENLNGINLSRQVTEFKKQYYASQDFMNAAEITALALNSASTAIEAGSIAVGYTAAGGLKLIPEIHVGGSGFGGSPHAVVQTGGKSFGGSAETVVHTLESITRALDKGASISSTLGSYQHRKDEWDFQRDLADKELVQIDSQIASANLRIAIAQQELDNQSLQIDNAMAIDDFMHTKYTNEDLYQWQLGQISSVYFKSYKLAYDLAKRAERCFRFEVGLQDSDFINFGYWDSLKKGLLSGEQLQYDLRRLESAYIEQNKRELELTKNVSLALLDPLALVMLRETGRCFARIPEEIFDLDYPGHYFRRIKSVSLTLPCVTGPYTTISCTVRLTKNSIRINTAQGDNVYPRNTDDAGLPADDERFIENNIPVKAIAASSGQNDSGVFELSFRDDRYLPFEGAGAISEWSLELFNDVDPDFGKPLRQFDYGTISDAILHIKYTAREDAGLFKNDAIKHLREYLVAASPTPAFQMFNLRRDFPTQWARFLNPTNAADGNIFEIAMSSELFRVLDRDKGLQVNKITLLARCTNAGDYVVVMTPPLPILPPNGSSTNSMQLTTTSTQYGGLHFAEKDVSQVNPSIEIAPTGPPVTWQIKMTGPSGNLQQDPTTKVTEVTDMIMVLGYEWGST